jgi:hypothetical protein
VRPARLDLGNDYSYAADAEYDERLAGAAVVVVKTGAVPRQAAEASRRAHAASTTFAHSAHFSLRRTPNHTMATCRIPNAIMNRHIVSIIATR